MYSGKEAYSVLFFTQFEYTEARTALSVLLAGGDVGFSKITVPKDLLWVQQQDWTQSH